MSRSSGVELNCLANAFPNMEKICDARKTLQKKGNSLDGRGKSWMLD
jgi:hypothetical protein